MNVKKARELRRISYDKDAAKGPSNRTYSRSNKTGQIINTPSSPRAKYQYCKKYT